MLKRGLKHSQEFKDSRSKALKCIPRDDLRKEIICIETQRIFKSISDAQKWLGEVIDMHSSKEHYSKGYHWAFVWDEESIKSLKEFVGKERYSQIPIQSRGKRGAKSIGRKDTPETIEKKSKSHLGVK